jgi:hypothetical protein
MKYKFYEQPPDFINDEEDQRDFSQEIGFLSDLLGVCKTRIRISPDHPCGEDVIFINGSTWIGYLDNHFYGFMISGFDLYGEYVYLVEEWKNK